MFTFTLTLYLWCRNTIRVET